MNRWLLGIVFLAFLIRIYNLNYNTSFLDEAQYIVIGQKILSGDIVSGIDAISWVGGSPFVYPVFSAIFYAVGGLVGSRFFTVLLGTFSVFLMYLFTKQLLFFKAKKMNQLAGVFAAAFMSLTTIALVSSRMAIYDGLAFPLFFSGVVLLHKALYSGERKFYVWAACVLFFSFLAKYITVIFFPFLLLLTFVLAYKTQNRNSIKGVLLYFCLPLLLLTGIYGLLNFANLSEFIANQGVVQNATEGNVARLFWEYTGVSYLLALLFLPFLWRQDKFLLVILLLCSFLPFFVHSLTGNTDSVQQHTFLSIIFLLPLIGAGLAFIFKKNIKLGVILTTLALLVQALVSIPQVRASESFWPDITESTAIIRQDLKPSDRILAESDDSMYLEVHDILPQDQVNGPFVFEYDGKEGIDAYTEAIENKYFKYIQLEGTYYSAEDLKAIEEAALNSEYQKIFVNGSLKVYKTL